MVNLSLEDIPLKSLKEVTEYLSRGITPSYTEDEGVIVINQRCIRDNKIVWENIRLTNPEKKKIASEKYLKQYDVLVNSTGVGTLGRSAQIKKLFSDTTVDSHVTILRPNDLVDPLFFGYAVNMLEKNIENLAEGSTGQTELSRVRLGEEIFINLHPKDTQKKIAKILSTIDEKIELNEKINKNLFQTADVIFKNYVGNFEDLDVVVLSENTKEIIRGFNSKYVDKSNLINFNQKVNKGTFLEKQHFKYLNENIEVPKEKFAKRRDILLNSLGQGTLGRPHYYNEDTDNVVVDQHITIIRANEELIPSTYIYEYLKSSAGQYHLDSLISGSTGMLMLNISEVRNLKIPILNKDKLKEFDSIVTPLFDKISKNFDEIDSLSKLRDTLLPKLMSGEIDVSKINCDL